MDINSYPLSRQLGEQLSAAGMKIAVAESCTGGDLSRIITRVMGSSQWFDRGFITYSNQSKIEMLGVDAALIKTQGAVSQQITITLAKWFGGIFEPRAMASVIAVVFSTSNSKLILPCSCQITSI